MVNDAMSLHTGQMLRIGIRDRVRFSVRVWLRVHLLISVYLHSRQKAYVLMIYCI